jgi:toxin HigB-1
VIQTFRDKRTAASRFAAFSPKLLMVDRAQNLNDLLSPPGNRLEKLRGDRAGYHSIRVDRQWRVCFRWHDGDTFDVEFCDYH